MSVSNHACCDWLAAPQTLQTLRMLTRLHRVSDIVSPEITALSEPWRHNTAALPTAAALMWHYGNLISK